MEMGFRPDEAVVLSRAKGADGFPVDKYRVKKALEKGCTPQLAIKIFT